MAALTLSAYLLAVLPYCLPPRPRGVEDWCYQRDCDRLGNRLFDAPGLGEPCQPTLRELLPPHPIFQLPQVLFKMDIEGGYLI